MLAALQIPVARAQLESRGHLESNMAAAAALGSAEEYRRWLLTYARFLSGTLKGPSGSLFYTYHPVGIPSVNMVHTLLECDAMRHTSSSCIGYLMHGVPKCPHLN